MIADEIMESINDIPDRFLDILTWLGYLFAVIGLLGTIWKSYQKWFSLKTFSWPDVDRACKKIINGILRDGFLPDIIVTIGRGGAIVGSIISGNLHARENEKLNISILGYDRAYRWIEGNRIEVRNELIELSPLRGQRVLIVAGDVLTGGTMKLFYSEIQKFEPSELKSACLLKGVTSVFSPDYYAIEVPGDFRMPWMYQGYGYVRDSRTPTPIADGKLSALSRIFTSAWQAVRPRIQKGE